MSDHADTIRRSHKKLDPEVKALRAVNRALDELPNDEQRKRVMEWAVARGLGKSWITLDRFRWIGVRCDHTDARGRCTSRDTHSVWNGSYVESFCERHAP